MCPHEQRAAVEDPAGEDVRDHGSQTGEWEEPEASVAPPSDPSDVWGAFVFQTATEEARVGGAASLVFRCVGWR